MHTRRELLINDHQMIVTFLEVHALPFGKHWHRYLFLLENGILARVGSA